MQPKTEITSRWKDFAADHPELRLFAGAIISLPSMSADELAEIIRIAETGIDRYITFRHDAVARIIDLAKGHPYMVHVIGKYGPSTRISGR
jgi:hypothetical protein